MWRMKKMFILFVLVHIIKGIRNNWLNKKSADNAFHFRSFENFDKIILASLKHLREICKQELNSITKYAPKLTFKSLYPSNIEYENVRLCLKLYDLTNANALKRLKELLNLLK